MLPVAHNRSLNLLYSLVGNHEIWVYTTTYTTLAVRFEKRTRGSNACNVMFA